MPRAIAAIGITNQRETTVIWDRATGRPIHNAIVWQDRRTADACAALRQQGHEPLIAGTHRPAARSVFLRHQDRLAARSCRWRARRGRAGQAGVRHHRQLPAVAPDRRQGCTPPTPPMRRARCCSTSAPARWDADLCGLFGVPMALLPQVRDCAGDFGTTAPDLFGGPIRILGVAGDQQAATVGQGCFKPGMMKSTYGTGCFALLNTGETPVASQQPAADHHRLSARRPAHLCARRRDLHRRRGGAMAARCAQDDRGRAGRERAGRRRRSRRAGLSGAGLRRARRAVVGRAMRAAPSTGSPAMPASPSSRAPRWKRSAIRPAICSTPCAPTGRPPATPCCGSTAAWRRATSPCSSSPTSWPRRSTGRR